MLAHELRIRRACRSLVSVARVARVARVLHFNFSRCIYFCTSFASSPSSAYPSQPSASCKDFRRTQMNKTVRNMAISLLSLLPFGTFSQRTTGAPSFPHSVFILRLPRPVNFHFGVTLKTRKALHQACHLEPKSYFRPFNCALHYPCPASVIRNGAHTISEQWQGRKARKVCTHNLSSTPLRPLPYVITRIAIGWHCIRI